MPKILYWTNADEHPLFITAEDYYEWNRPTTLPQREEAVNKALDLLLVNPDWAFYVTPAPLQVEEYPWDKPWILPNRSDSFPALIQPFTFAPDEHVLEPAASFGGEDYSDWDWKPPTQQPASTSVQAIWSFGDEETPDSLSVEDYPWDAMPMRLHAIRAAIFTDTDELPSSITTEDVYEWLYRPPLAPFLAQPLADQEPWGEVPLTTADEHYDVLSFLPPKQTAYYVPSRFALLSQDEETYVPIPISAFAVQELLHIGIQVGL